MCRDAASHLLLFLLATLVYVLKMKIFVGRMQSPCIIEKFYPRAVKITIGSMESAGI